MCTYFGESVTHHKMLGIPEGAREPAALVAQHPRAVLHLGRALGGPRPPLRRRRRAGHGAAAALRRAGHGAAAGRRRGRRGPRGRRWRRAVAAEARAGAHSAALRHDPGYWPRPFRDWIPRLRPPLVDPGLSCRFMSFKADGRSRRS